MPKVSVIVPTYNVEQYLVECLESIVNQTLKDIEIICVDDGSTDNSGKILDEYAQKDSRIKVIHKENGGYGKAMNVGIDNASGEYIGIVEPDDFIELDMYETLYDKAVESEVDFVKGDFYKYSTNPTANAFYFSPCIKTDIYNKIIKPIEHINVFNGSLCIWAALYNRAFLIKKDIQFLETPGASFQDTSFGLKVLFEAQKALFLDKAYYYYRIDNINSSVKNNSKIFCICDEFYELEEKYKFSSEKIKKMINTLKIDKYTWNYNRLAEEGRKKFFKIYSKELKKIILNENYIKNFIPYGIIINAINILKLKNKKAKNKVLLIEHNVCHGECLPAYINYFLQLKYDVDVLLNKKMQVENPLEIFKNDPSVTIKYSKEIDIIKLLNSDIIKNYKYCFINSDIIYAYKEIFVKLITKPHIKTTFINVVHRLENLQKVKQRAIPVILKSFDDNTKKNEVNPCYFGNLKEHKKNICVNFVVAGNIEAKRKNYNILFDCVKHLHLKNITNFKITIIGSGNALCIPDDIKQSFDIKGRLSYSDMYEEMQNADFFLTLLDPDNIDHERYITIGTSGSFQLINGFNVPCLIAEKFAKVYGYNEKNSIIYTSNADLKTSMEKAINLSCEEYKNLKNELKNLTEKIYANSINNFQRILKTKPYYLLSFATIKVMFKYLLQKIFSVRNNSNKTHKIITIFGLKIKIKKEFLKKLLWVGNVKSKNNKWYKVIYVLGMKFSFRNKKKEVKVRQELLYNYVNSCLQNVNNYSEQVSAMNQEFMEFKTENKSQNIKILSAINSLQKQFDCEIKNSKNAIKNLENKYNCAVNKLTPQKLLRSFVYHLADHCNLQCQSCDHFSPLAKKKLASIESYEKDIKRLSELCNQELEIIKLMGGEPLLHPDIIKFMQISRQYFPKTRIEIVTNGILLNQQKEDFWMACKNFNITIVPTKYPINIDYDKAKATAMNYGVKYEYYNNNEDIIKTSYHLPLDPNGKQNCGESFINCFHANWCVMLKEGRLYTCTVAPNIEHFNKYFEQNIPLTEKDSIDIYKANSMEEVLEFLAKPIPFCKYCKVSARTFKHEWANSKKDIKEWT